MEATIKHPAPTAPGALEDRNIDPHGDSWQVPRVGRES
jgi:hypothetical protein